MRENVKSLKNGSLKQDTLGYVTEQDTVKKNLLSVLLNSASIVEELFFFFIKKELVPYHSLLITLKTNKNKPEEPELLSFTFFSNFHFFFCPSRGFYRFRRN